MSILSNRFSKTLEYTGASKDFTSTGSSWNILLVSQNSYAVFSMLGNSVIEYFEEPLAIKSFNNDEVYVAISQAAGAALEKFPTDKLLIVSESNDVSAEILSMQLKQPGDVLYLECNQYAKQPIMDVDLTVLPHYIKAITPEAIGAAIYRMADFGFKFNFLSKTDYKAPDMIRVMGIDLTKEQLMIYTGIIGFAIVAVCYLCSLALQQYITSLETKRGQLEQEATEQQAKLTELKQSSGKIDIYSAAKSIDQSMVDKILYYNSVGADIPSKVWLTYFYADTKGAYGIKGETTSVDDVYLFFRNIKAQVPKSDLILSKLSVDDQEGMIDIEKAQNITYTFELTNGGFGSVKPVDPNEAPKDEKDGQNQNGGSTPQKVDSSTSGANSMSVPNLPDLPN